ncbi:MAG: hypothetical protein ACJA09_002642 [Alcanivorax sp.]|jgi:hypothetical protein
MLAPFLIDLRKTILQGCRFRENGQWVARYCPGEGMSFPPTPVNCCLEDSVSYDWKSSPSCSREEGSRDCLVVDYC